MGAISLERLMAVFSGPLFSVVKKRSEESRVPRGIVEFRHNMFSLWRQCLEWIFCFHPCRIDGVPEASHSDCPRLSADQRSEAAVGFVKGKLARVGLITGIHRGISIFLQVK